MDNIQPDLDDQLSQEQWTRRARQQLEQGMRQLDHGSDTIQALPPYQAPSSTTAASPEDISAAAAAAAKAAAGFSPVDHGASLHVNASNTSGSRLKVSRACDECRKRKLKCNCDPELGVAVSNCAKAHRTCQFTYEPLQRGPAKGYIRTLEEENARLKAECSRFQAMLELGPGSDTLPVQNADIGLQIDIDDIQERKRKISHLQRPQEYGIHLDNSNHPGLEKICFSRYVEKIHRTTSILPPDEKLIINASICHVPHHTQAAFYSVFHATMCSTAYTGDSSSIDDRTASEAYQAFSVATLQNHPTILLFQCLLLLILDASNRGTLIINGSPGTPPWELSAHASAMSKQIAHFDFALTPNLPNVEKDTQYRIARSTIVSFKILDAFMAFGNKEHGFVEREYIPVGNGDLHLLGQRMYSLAHLADLLQRLRCQQLDDISRPILSDMKDLMLEIIPKQTTNDPITQLARWYTVLQIESVYRPLARPALLLRGCSAIVTLLSSSKPPLRHASDCPLTYHFSGLVAHLLIQLCVFHDTKVEAIKILARLDNALQRLVPLVDTCSFDAGVRDAVARKRTLIVIETANGHGVTADHTSLEQTNALGRPSSLDALADANDASLQQAAKAAAEAASAAQMLEGEAFDGMKLSTEGYLTSLLVHDA